MITILKIPQTKLGFKTGFWITYFLKYQKNSSYFLSQVINILC
jgi:hypothetical protein